MPSFRLDLKSNDGTKTFIKGELSPLSGTHTISENSITNCYFDSIDEKSDNTTYDSDTGLLTLPIKMKGLSKTINATTPDEGLTISDNVIFSVGDNNYYVIEESSTLTFKFKHYYANDTKIGSGTFKFKHWSVIQPTPMPQLDSPSGLKVTNNILTFGAVENATSYEVFVDNVSIGTYVVPSVKTLTLPTDDELGNITAEGYNIEQGDIQVSSSVYNAITALNRGGSLTDFGNTCGLTIPTTQVKYHLMGIRAIATESAEKTEDGKYKGYFYIQALTSSQSNIYVIEFDYANNTATYTAIDGEEIDPENHTIGCTFSKADGSTLLLFCYKESD